METLVARAEIPDYHLTQAKYLKDIEERVANELAHSLAKGIIESGKFHETMVKREEIEFMLRGTTVYEAEVIVLTPKEAKEFNELREFRKQMKNFVL